VGSPLVAWLFTLDADRLAAILLRRPEAIGSPPVRSLSALADRLQSRNSVTVAFRALPLPAAQLVEVLQSIGGPVAGRDQLAATLGRTPDDPDLAATLQILSERALVWPDGSSGLRMAGPLWSAFPYPLRLGAPAQRLLEPLPVQQLRDIATALGVPPGRSKRDALQAACGTLTDAESVRALVAEASPEAGSLLEEAAHRGPLISAPQLYSSYPRQSQTEVAWAVDHGLLVYDGWQYAQMPAEVARALRGPEWHPRFDPHPPALSLAEVDPPAVSREAAAAAGVAIEQLGALLETCAAAPVAVLKAGGVGVRELRRLAKSTGCGEPEARLWLELAYAAGLVAQVKDQVLPTGEYDAWCAAEPAGRLVPLLRTWLTLPAAPLADLGPGNGPAPAALTRDPTSLLAYDLRPQLLGVLNAVPDDQGLAGDPEASLAALLRWRAPMSISPGLDIGPLVAGVWREASLLGIVAHGMLTPLGRALCRDPQATADVLPAREGSPAAGAMMTPDTIAPETTPAATLDEVAEGLLPASVRTAMFQADLTAVVPGVPAAALAALLDGAADLESRGGATTWRFSQASVRRALDSGLEPPTLLAGLRAIAVGGALPQPLEYLVGDVARRHGAIRVREVKCVLHATDPALIAEVVGARALAALQLTALAPTVVASAAPAEETLAALRAAGYAPVGESADGSTRIERVAPHRAPGRRRSPTRPARPGRTGRILMSSGPALDLRALAAALLAAPAGAAGPQPPAGRRTPHPGGLAVDPAQLALELGLPGWDADDLAAEEPDDLSGYLDQAEEHDELEEAAAYIVRFATQLSHEEQVLLLASIDDGAPLKISYTNAGGESSVRVIEPLGLDNHRLVAWCTLRDEERMFSLDRIHAVSPA
jgi:hypothetical protein